MVIRCDKWKANQVSPPCFGCGHVTCGYFITEENLDEPYRTEGVSDFSFGSAESVLFVSEFLVSESEFPNPL